MNSRTTCSPSYNYIYFFFLLLAFLIPNNAFAQELWVTDGPVYGLARSGNTLYVGGAFTHVGPPTGTFATSDPTTGAAQSGGPRVTGTINAIVPDGSGGWFIGGSITQVGSTIRKNIAHILPNRTLDSAFAPDSNGEVFAMALDGTILYVGGDFSYIGGQDRENIAAIDAATGNATSLDLSANDVVRALEFNDSHSTLYVGGNFHGANSFGGQARNYAAAINVAAGTVTAWNPNANGAVKALAAFPLPPAATTAIILGGSFHGANSIGADTRNYIAGVRIDNGAAFPWAPNLDGEVHALETASIGAIYAGGAFSSVGADPRTRLAVISSLTGNAGAWNPSPSGTVESLVNTGSTLYVGGAFTTISGVSQNGIAAFDTTSGELTAFNPSIGEEARAIAYDGTSIAFGGDFVSTGMVSRQGLAAFNVTTGEATSLNVPVVGLVTSIVPVDDKIYLAGSFGSIGGELRTSLAALDTSGNVLGFDGSVWGVVWSLKRAGNLLYVCGAFNHVLGDIRNNLAAIDLTTGALTAWNPNADGACKTIDIDSNGNIFAGGSFNNIGVTARKNLAAIDSSGAVTSWNPAPNGDVDAVHIDGNYIYAGGQFNAIAGKPRSFLAQFSRSSGGLTDWDAQANSPVLALASYDNMLIAGGYFVIIGQAFRYGIAALDPITAFANEWNPMLKQPMVLTLNSSADRLLAGGMFQSTNLDPLAYLANVTPLTSAVVPPAPSGTPMDGRTVTVVNEGTWSGVGLVTKIRQWQRCTANGSGCYDITGQTGSSYVLGHNDVGSKVRIHITADDSLSSAEAGGATSAVVAPKNSKLPKVTGKAKVGQILSASPGSWNGVSELTISYGWQRCGSTCKNIAKAKSNKYKVAAKDVGKKLQVVVKASKNGSSKTTASSKKTKKVSW